MEELTVCPVQLRPEDELVLPHHRRAFVEYVQAEQGARTLLVHYRELEIEFDEPELFGFALQLIGQERFRAESATRWGTGYSWPRVSELLTALIERGVLKPAVAFPTATRPSTGLVPSPLPAATCRRPRTWLECAELSLELAGQKVELAHLELLVPLHRVAHSMLDREGRQVGEANVFPPQLRLQVPTEWRSCQYPGSRYQDEYPLNASALRSMQRWWRPLLTVMERARKLYLQRFLGARAGFSLLDAHLFSCLLMGLPAYAQQRARERVANGALHPVLSSLARLADGARMTANELLTADTVHAPIDGTGLHDAAERTNLFLSTYGVCAGSRKSIDTFLSRFAQGAGPGEDALDDELEAFCAELDNAVEYGLHAICGYALGSLAWAQVSETYEALHGVLRTAPETGLATRIAADWKLMAAALGTPALRAEHRRLYEAMLAHCIIGLEPTCSNAHDAGASPQPTRSAFPALAVDVQVAPPSGAESHGAVSAADSCKVMRAQRAALAGLDETELTAECLAEGRGHALALTSVTEPASDFAGHVAAPVAGAAPLDARDLASVQAQLCAAFSGFAEAAQLAEVVLQHVRAEQELVAEAELYQARASASLGRAPGRLPLTAATLFLGHRLRHPAARLPYVMDALRDELGLRIAVTASALTLEAASDV